MQITKDILLARREELQQTIKKMEGDLIASNGALQMLDILIQTANAPEPEEKPKQG